jgi:hypothetical protein
MPFKTSGFFLLEKFYHRPSVGRQIFMGLIAAGKRADFSFQLVPPLTGYLAASAGCASGDID